MGGALTHMVRTFAVTMTNAPKPSRSARRLWVGTTTLLALSTSIVIACGDGAEPSAEPQYVLESDPELVGYLRDTWGIEVSLVDESGVEEQRDGTLTLETTVRVTVDGLGARELATNTVIIPDEYGTTTSFFVSNPDGSDERYFLFDRENRYVTIGNAIDDQSVIVSANVDGTYEVDIASGEEWTTIATDATGYEALQTVATYNEYTTITPHILLLAFAVANTPSTLETRIPQTCVSGGVAASPAVCSIFREFCDCAACLVLEREGACDLCPEL